MAIDAVEPPHERLLHAKLLPCHHVVPPDESLIPLEIVVGLVERRLVLVDRRLVLVDGRLQRAIVEPEEEVAGLDGHALADRLVDDDPVDARTHRDGGDRLDPADGLLADRHILHLRGGGDDGDGCLPADEAPCLFPAMEAVPCRCIVAAAGSRSASTRV